MLVGSEWRCSTPKSCQERQKWMEKSPLPIHVENVPGITTLRCRGCRTTTSGWRVTPAQMGHTLPCPYSELVDLSA
jgi:hypothetical protein